MDKELNDIDLIINELDEDAAYHMRPIMVQPNNNHNIDNNDSWDHWRLLCESE